MKALGIGAPMLYRDRLRAAPPPVVTRPWFWAGSAVNMLEIRAHGEVGLAFLRQARAAAHQVQAWPYIFSTRRWGSPSKLYRTCFRSRLLSR